MCSRLLEDLREGGFGEWADRGDFQPKEVPLRWLGFNMEGAVWILDQRLDAGDKSWLPEFEDPVYMQALRENFDETTKDFPQEHHIQSAYGYMRQLHQDQPFSYEATRAYMCCRASLPFSKAVATHLFPEKEWVVRFSTKQDGLTRLGHYLICDNGPRGEEKVFDFTCRPESKALNFMRGIEREVRHNGGWTEEVLLLAGSPLIEGQILPMSGSRRAALANTYKRQASYLPMPQELWYLLIKNKEHRVLLLDNWGNPLCEQ
jgi:hypothetical protein